eukprot:scaffold25894_cov279-Cylindrotheca_fusiformis.AAC.1
MSTEKEAVERSSSQGTLKASRTSDDSSGVQSTSGTPPSKGAKETGESSEEGPRGTGPQVQEEDRKLPANESSANEDETAETVATGSFEADPARQVIAVSASKGPAAFFNLARKFLVTDEMCDLSALEGAIVSAVDAAHLLERSQLATIVRVHTSYVTVEPKRRKQPTQQTHPEDNPTSDQAGPITSGTSAQSSISANPTASRARAQSDVAGQQQPQQTPSHKGAQSGQRSASGGRELRRARIVITVRRTESYKQWLQENPLQAIIAGNADDGDGPTSTASVTSQDRPSTI